MEHWITHTLTALGTALATLAGAWAVIRRSGAEADATTTKAEGREKRSDFRFLFDTQSHLLAALQAQVDDLRSQQAEYRRDREECRAENEQLKARVAYLEAEVTRLKMDKA
jgi:chromosome segregation ATPase